MITTNLVLIELTVLLTSPLRMPRAQQIQVMGDLQTGSSVEVVFVDPAAEAAAWSLWRTCPDKDWSMVDCTSFVVMQDRKLTEALTTDHHVEQAGYVRLLK